jgi:hypothetical protein
VRAAQGKWHHLQTAMRRNAGRVLGSRSSSELTSAESYTGANLSGVSRETLVWSHRPAAAEVRYSNSSGTRVQFFDL